MNISKSLSQSPLNSSNAVKLTIDSIKLNEYEMCCIDHQNQIDPVLFSSINTEEKYNFNDNIKTQVKTYSTDEIIFIFDNFKKNDVKLKLTNRETISIIPNLPNIISNKFEEMKDKTEKGRLLDIYPPVTINHSSFHKKRRNHLPTIKNSK